MERSILTIAGFDPSGGAGLQNDLKTIGAHGFFGLSVVTALTFQNSGGQTHPPVVLEPDAVVRQIRAVSSDASIRFIKIGLVGSASVSSAVSQELRRLSPAKVVLDPIMWAGSGDKLIEGDSLEVLRPLLRLCTVVTPNVQEAEVLSGRPVENLDDAKAAAEIIAGLGPESVVVKGGHLANSPFSDVVFDSGKSTIIEGRKVGVPNVHGSGCSYSTSLLCNLAEGYTVCESALRAKRFVEAVLENARTTQMGNMVADPLRPVARKAENLDICRHLAEAVSTLEQLPGFEQLIPEVGTNIAMAPKDPLDVRDVVGLTGRICLVSGKARTYGYPFPGGSWHMARMALGLRRKTRTHGCCMNVKYSPLILEACRRMGLLVAEFQRDEEPQGTKTMDWAIESTVTDPETIPDIIYDTGSVGKEPMVRILGSDPGEVVEKVKRILEALR